MSNYDKTITFSSSGANPNSSSSGGQLCTPQKTGGNGVLGATNNKDVFGTGNLLPNSSNSKVIGNGTGIYSSQNRSELTQLIIPKELAQSIQTNSQSMPTTDKSWAFSGYSILRNIAVVIAMLILMLFAFANILHLDINTYSVKKLLPNLIVALVGSYLVIYVIFFLSVGVDFLYRFAIFSPYNAMHPFYNLMNGVQSLNISALTSENAITLVFNLGNNVLGNTAAQQQSLLAAGLGMFFLGIPAIVVFAFEYVMALRPIAVGLLTVISPIAFACYVMPQTQHLFKKWWTLLLIAMFYAPAVNFVFYLLSLANFQGSTGVAQILLILVKSIILVILIRLPFTIESDAKKISMALEKSSLSASLGLSKNANGELKVKQTNKVETVTDKTLQSKAAQSIIAPVNKNFNRNMLAGRQETRQFASSFSQIVNGNKQTTIQNLESISESAHKSNKARSFWFITPCCSAALSTSSGKTSSMPFCARDLIASGFFGLFCSTT
jgi:hypothetical protein